MTWIVFLVVAITAVVGLQVDEYELKFVTFVHRHGDRSPGGTYPTDPYRNESIWNNGWGELTNGGKQNVYGLGKWLRERYGGFLPKIYNKRDYEVQSTDVSRTLMSAYLVLASLYEPTGTDVWNVGLKWQPIPVHTTPMKLDNVLAAAKPCPRHFQLLAQLMLSKEIKDKLNVWAPATSEIAKHAGYNSTNPLTNFNAAVRVYDSLFIQNLTGLQIPKWSTPYFPKPMSDMSSLAFRLRTYNKPLQRLSCGLLVKDILTHFKAKATGTLTKKIWQYSAHDVTIVGLRQCLGFNDTDLPPYASALVLELRAKKDEHVVRVVYKFGNQVKNLVVPGCVENCPLAKFEELVKPIIPEDWEAECKAVKTTN